MKTLKIIAAAIVMFGLASGAQAIVVFDIQDDPNYSGVWNISYTSGYEFEVANSLTFNALGLFDVHSATPLFGNANSPGLLYSHEVGVWDSAGTLVASATVDPGDPTTSSVNTYGNWVYQSIAQTTLGAGTYRVGALYLGNQDDARMVQQTVINNVGGVTYTRGMYSAGSSLTAPATAYPAGEHQYFGPTLLSVPDGGITLILLGFGIAGLAIVRRKLT